MPRSLLALLCAAALLAGACSKKQAGSPAASGPPTSTTPPPAAFLVELTGVYGDLPDGEKSKASKDAGAVVEQYLKAAFLDGPYPKTAFPQAFARFSPGAAALATSRQDVTTNSALGPEMENLRATLQTARVALYARDNLPQGATTDLVLEAVGKHKVHGDITLRVTGDLYMVPTPQGWQIVGFRLLNEADGAAGTVTSSTAGGGVTTTTTGRPVGTPPTAPTTSR